MLPDFRCWHLSDVPRCAYDVRWLGHPRASRKISKKGQAFDTPGPDLPPKWGGYFSEVEMLLKLVLS
jgi:hypothetical protein